MGPTGAESGAEISAETSAAAGDEPNGRGLPRVIASAPWVVVLVGVSVLAVLLVAAMLSFREPEQPAAWTPGPPMVLPTPGEVTATPSTPTPTTASSAGPTTVPPPPSGSSTQPAAPSRTSSAAARADADRSPEGAVPGAPATPAEPVDTGVLSASYQVDSADPISFRARLVVRNGTARSSDWTVELRFTGQVSGVRASSGPGVSVTIKGAGWYLLSGAEPLDAGAGQTVDLRFTRVGTGEYPAHCAVNGDACSMG
ncbi:hypothetical protein D2L64_06030 [Micromonospora radicis]|uniref:CBM2 domain-containing protein n=1 Tax=Micromonospora radicis TaxID=1894971 RepID=A0A418MXP4_9ACTN|nr:hypothetical protein D2L64_06030 [Micromonospora radicis]